MMHTIYMGKLMYLNFELEFKNSIDDLLPLGRIARSTDRAQSALISIREVRHRFSGFLWLLLSCD